MNLKGVPMKATDPNAETISAGDLADELSVQRDRAAVRRADELARLTAEAEHKRALSDVAEITRRAELDRAEREASASASASLARVYRESRDAGERTRIAAHMARSGESRALRLERLRGVNLKVLVPVLLGFAAWSTTGVQAGGARLMHVTDTDPTWWALWVLEPVLIGAVVWVIIVRARLAASGGRLNAQAAHIATGCLTTSILLNLVAAAEAPAAWTLGTVAALVGAMLAHSIGPVGAAATAHLIGVIDESIAEADPWTDEQGANVPLLSELNLDLDAPAESTVPTAGPSTIDHVAELPETHEPAPSAEPSFSPDLHEQDAPEAPAIRPNKGVSIPRAARKAPEPTSARALSDDALRERLAALIESGELPADASVRRVQSALGIGFERAKRLLAEPQELAA